jgi:hypothetical protein
MVFDAKSTSTKGARGIGVTVKAPRNLSLPKTLVSKEGDHLSTAFNDATWGNVTRKHMRYIDQQLRDSTFMTVIKKAKELALPAHAMGSKCTTIIDIDNSDGACGNHRLGMNVRQLMPFTCSCRTLIYQLVAFPCPTVVQSPPHSISSFSYLRRLCLLPCYSAEFNFSAPSLLVLGVRGISMLAFCPAPRHPSFSLVSLAAVLQPQPHFISSFSYLHRLCLLLCCSAEFNSSALLLLVPGVVGWSIYCGSVGFIDLASLVVLVHVNLAFLTSLILCGITW